MGILRTMYFLVQKRLMSQSSHSHIIGHIDIITRIIFHFLSVNSVTATNRKGICLIRTFDEQLNKTKHSIPNHLVFETYVKCEN